MTTLIPYSHLSVFQHQELLMIRNQPDIVRYTQNPKNITLNEHLAWVNELSAKPQQLYLAVRHQDTIIGGVHAHDIDTPSPTWGIFFAPTTAPLISSATAVYFLDLLFLTFQSHTIHAKIHPNNVSAQKFNERLGFMHDSSLNGSDFCLMKLSYMQWQSRKSSKLFAPILQMASTYTLKGEE